MKSDACSGMSSDIEDLKSSVSNGKTSIASAITDKGISTSATDTFDTMAVNIRLLPIEPPRPSTLYESKSLGSWTSTTDVNNFFAAHNVENGFSGIKIGNYVTISDGTYNAQWVVAGFNLEHNATASDGTVYDNGYGMLMIPKTQLTLHNWYPQYQNVCIPYMNSSIHSFINYDVYNALSSKLGNHIIQRNVLLGSVCNGSSPHSGTTSAYTWTKSYLTLMSMGQMNGTFKANNNQYDDGEANYKLPLFDHENYWLTNSYIWSRGVRGFYSNNFFSAWNVDNYGENMYSGVHGTFGVRPLMLLR